MNTYNYKKGLIVNIVKFSFRFAITCSFVLMLFGCAPIQIKVDYNKAINFDNYKSYAWIPNEQLDIVDINFEKQLLDDLVTNTSNNVLNEKGFSVNKENPDFLVSYFLVIDTKTDVYVVENYYSNIQYATPATTSSTRDYQRLREDTYEQGILIIDIMDQHTKERIWRGYAQSRIGIHKEPEKQEKRVITATKKILANFPP